MSDLGKLYAVGLGPGNPEWISRRGYQLIMDADVIVVPKGRKTGRSTAREIVDQLHPAPEKIVELEFPMTTDQTKLTSAWRQAGAEVIRLMSGGKQVVFVTLGDPSLYSTFIYLRRAVRETAPAAEIEVVPGIPSFCGAAALLEMELCESDDRLALAGFNRDRAEIEAMLRNFETVILYKIAGKLPELIAVLEATGRLAESVLVHRAGFPDAVVVRDLRQAVDDDRIGYFSMVIVRKKYTLTLPLGGGGIGWGCPPS